MTTPSGDLDRNYYQRRYDEEIAKSLSAADMTLAMAHRRLAARYAAVLRSDAAPVLVAAREDGPGSASSNGSRRA